MMKYLNSAMLNSTLIKQKRFIPKFKMVKEPFAIIKRLAGLFDYHLASKKISLVIDENIYGSREAVTKMKTNGIEMDIELYE
mmetsp:Transcript_14630/g.22677  ORF Transcript_14630/g.22677 Transcript_14630/m.22677 type:complete len:82 (-) Transcript_14630:3554-3799(-)